MRQSLIVLLITLGLHTSLSSAADYSVDSAQSYISVPVPTWERGEQWGFVDSFSNEIAGGYIWKTATSFEKYSLGGLLGFAEVPGSDYLGAVTLAVDSKKLVAAPPAGLPFTIPSYFAMDKSTGEYRACAPWCPTPDSLSWYWEDQKISVKLQGGVLTLDGSSNSLFAWANQEIFGGYEAPPAIEYPYANAWYSYHIVATVPEPQVALMLLVGLIPLIRRHLAVSAG